MAGGSWLLTFALHIQSISLLLSCIWTYSHCIATMYFRGNSLDDWTPSFCFIFKVPYPYVGLVCHYKKAAFRPLTHYSFDSEQQICVQKEKKLPNLKINQAFSWQQSTNSQGDRAHRYRNPRFDSNKSSTFSRTVCTLFSHTFQNQDLDIETYFCWNSWPGDENKLPGSRRNRWAIVYPKTHKHGTRVG